MMSVCRYTLLSAAIWALFSLTACTEEVDPNADIEGIQLEMPFMRTDSLMWACAEAIKNDTSLDPFEAYLTYLKPEKDFFYSLLGIDDLLRQNPALREQRLSEEELDSLLAYEIVPKLSNPNMYQLLDTVRKSFAYDQTVYNRILPLMKRMTLHFEELDFPEFRTHVTGYIPGTDWRGADQIVPMPGYFSIGLHYFMGPDFEYYSPNIAHFQKRRCDPAYMEVQIMSVIAEGMVAPIQKQRQSRLIDKMIRKGIKQHFLEEMLPGVPDSMRFLYTSSQMEWADYYEGRIYKELIPNLYSTDFVVHRDFLSDKPYTTQLSTESAPRIGEYCGYKIVKNYLKRNPNVSLEELCNWEDYELIFRESRYKPS